MAGLSTKHSLRQVGPHGSYGPEFRDARMRENHGGTDVCSAGHTSNYPNKTT